MARSGRFSSRVSMLVKWCMALHAERDIIMANNLRPSARHILVLYRNECTYLPTLFTFW